MPETACMGKIEQPPKANGMRAVMAKSGGEAARLAARGVFDIHACSRRDR